MHFVLFLIISKSPRIQHLLQLSNKPKHQSRWFTLKSLRRSWWFNVTENNCSNYCAALRNTLLPRKVSFVLQVFVKQHTAASLQLQNDREMHMKQALNQQWTSVRFQSASKDTRTQDARSTRTQYVTHTFRHTFTEIRVCRWCIMFTQWGL